MELREIFVLFLGLACATLGVGLLYLSWKSRVQLKEAYCVTGWLLILNSNFYWVFLTGWEFGLIYGITVPSFLALAIAAINGEKKTNVMRVLRRNSVRLPSVKTFLRFLRQFFLVVPFALAASVTVSFGIGNLLPATSLNQMVFMVIVMPILWGLFSYWSIADTRTIRPVLSLLGLSAMTLLPLTQG